MRRLLNLNSIIQTTFTESNYRTRTTGTSDCNEYIPVYAISNHKLLVFKDSNARVMEYSMPINDIQGYNYVRTYSDLIIKIKDARNPCKYNFKVAGVNHNLNLDRGMVYDNNGNVLMCLAINKDYLFSVDSEVLKTNPRNVAGIKLFLGSSTGNMLVDNQEVLEKIFSSTKMLIAVHCEDEATIKANLEKYKEEFGDDIPMKYHHLIRSAEACYLSSSKAIALAKKTGARLHVFHLSTAKEMELFTNKIPLEEKQITAEVCVHHLWFTDADYDAKGSLIKWNPAVKTQADKDALWKALLDDRIDVIATDHAPHTLEEKINSYTTCPSGGPLVQHALVAMFESHHQGKISVEKIVEKMCHNPAKIFKIENRGFIKEGYFADIAIVNAYLPWNVKKENILYKCGWSPFEGYNFKSRVTHTFVNGKLVYANGKVKETKVGQRLLFDRNI